MDALALRTPKRKFPCRPYPTAATQSRTSALVSPLIKGLSIALGALSRLIQRPRSESLTVSTVLDMIERGWDNFLARPNGHLSLRFVLQPTMAALLALRAGVQDAREGKQGYLWAVASNGERRFQLLHEGWRGARTPFVVAIVLDCIYQLITVQFIYPLELLFTATLLALVPYALLRGPFNRIARVLLNFSVGGG